MSLHLEKVILLSTEDKWKITSGNMTQRHVMSGCKFEIEKVQFFQQIFFHLDFSGKTVSADFKINFWGLFFSYKLLIIY